MTKSTKRKATLINRLTPFLLALVIGANPAMAQTEALIETGPRQTAAALAEGMVVIQTTTDEAEAADLLAGFRSLYPGIAVRYVDLNSTELYERFLSEVAYGAGTADVIWSSAMDLQVKLVNDGYAQQYVPPEAASLPAWAVWRNEAYGVTAEPVAFVYNRHLLPEARVPRTHEALTRALTADPDTWKGKLAAYDPERSGAGFLFLTQDIQVTPRTWDLVRAMGQVGVKLYTSTGTMLDRVVAGEQVLAYNVIGSYALERAKREPVLGVVLPSDYTIVLSRIAFIPRTARHPSAARLFLNFLLSADGQRRLAAQSLGPARVDAQLGPAPADGRATLRPIQVGPELLTYLDQIKRARFIKQWQRVLQGR